MTPAPDARVGVILTALVISVFRKEYMVDIKHIEKSRSRALRRAKELREQLAEARRLLAECEQFLERNLNPHHSDLDNDLYREIRIFLHGVE